MEKINNNLENNLDRGMTHEEFEQYFENFQKTACRLELLPTYSVEGNTDYEKYMDTGKIPERSGGWFDLLKRNTEQGKIIERIRYIPFLSDYIKYELEAYKQNIESGERIMFIKPEDIESQEISNFSDFWIFDDSRVIQMNYREDGYFTGFTEISKENVLKYIDLYKKLKFKSKDISNFK